MSWFAVFVEDVRDLCVGRPTVHANWGHTTMSQVARAAYLKSRCYGFVSGQVFSWVCDGTGEEVNSDRRVGAVWGWGDKRTFALQATCNYANRLCLDDNAWKPAPGARSWLR